MKHIDCGQNHSIAAIMLHTTAWLWRVPACRFTLSVTFREAAEGMAGWLQFFPVVLLWILNSYPEADLFTRQNIKEH